METTLFGDEQQQHNNLTAEQEVFIKNGQTRAIDKYCHFFPDILYIEGPRQYQAMQQVKRVITAHESTIDSTFNPRFLEVYVETAFFCQLVRLHTRHDLLSDQQLAGIFDWLREIVNSFAHF